MSAPRILIVDDDKVVRTVLERQLTTRGCDVVCAETCSEAIHVAQEQKLDLLVIDVRLDADPLETIRDGFVLVGWLRRMLPDPSFRVIIHTKDRSPEVDARAEAEGNTEECMGCKTWWIWSKGLLKIPVRLQPDPLRDNPLATGGNSLPSSLDS